jgi:hypothetical protein
MGAIAVGMEFYILGCWKVGICYMRESTARRGYPFAA